jgi:hypothetical protein
VPRTFPTTDAPPPPQGAEGKARAVPGWLHQLHDQPQQLDPKHLTLPIGVRAGAWIGPGHPCTLRSSSTHAIESAIDKPLTAHSVREKSHGLSSILYSRSFILALEHPCEQTICLTILGARKRGIVSTSWAD